MEEVPLFLSLSNATKHARKVISYNISSWLIVFYFVVEVFFLLNHVNSHRVREDEQFRECNHSNYIITHIYGFDNVFI